MHPDNVIMLIVGLAIIACSYRSFKTWWEKRGLDRQGSKFRIMSDCFVPSFKPVATLWSIGLAFILLGAIPIVRDFFLSP